MVGGFPCQAFSVAGKRRGFDDTRGTLFFEVARILKDKKPKYFLLENVKGLLSHDKGRTFQTILGTLSELGYDVQWEIFNSKNHGVPQNRERIYIKGFLREKCGSEVLSLRKAVTETDAQQGKNKETEHIEDEVTKDSFSIDGNKISSVPDSSQYYPSTLDGNFFAVTTHPRGTSFSKKQDNYIIEEKDTTILEDNELSNLTNISTQQKIIKLNDKSQGQAVYSTEGLGVTLSANGGGQGGKTGLYLMPSDDKPQIKKVGNIRPNGKSQSGTVYDAEGLSPTLNCTDYKAPTKILLKNNTKKGYAEAEDGDEIVYGQSNCRGRVQKQKVPTLNTSDGSGAGVVIKDNTKKGSHILREGDGLDIANTNPLGRRVRDSHVPTLNTKSGGGSATYDGYSIRKLTPVECEKLQGFPKSWTKEGADGSLISDTQRYKCCGNAVTTNVVRDIINTWDMKFD